MIKNIQSLVQRFHKEQRGQMLVMTAVMFVLLIAVASLTVDVGNIYLGYRQLKASTDAAAMAAAGNLANPSATSASVTNMATYYSSKAGNQNTFGDLTGVGITVTPECITGTAATGVGTSSGIACVPLGSGITANAVKIMQTATVPLYFAGMFGWHSITLTAYAAASMRGASSPYNVAIVMDTTSSMGSGTTDSCTGRLTPIHCAELGLQTLLSELSPCMPGTSCTPADTVSLFTFPAVVASTANDYYNCGTPTTINYWGGLAGPTDTSFTADPLLPVATTGANNNNPVAIHTPVTYQITGFLNDYRASDSSTTLSSSSELVKAAGTSSSSFGCLSTPGGAGTYYAGVIYAAQDALAAQKKANPNTQNALIILTDGEANTASSNMFTTLSPYYTNGTYMSAKDECQQAILAAQAATAAGTAVYAVGFGSESSGCSTDTTNLGLTYPAGVSYNTLNPCETIESMASKPAYWFTDEASKDLGCTSSSQTYTNIQDIFSKIGAGLTTPKLIPYGTT